MSNKTDNAADVGQLYPSTPGPWFCHSGMVWAKAGMGKDGVPNSDIPIAHMDRESGNGTKPTERDSNAHFIALACNSYADLLAACESVMAASVGVNGGKPYDGEPEWITKTRAAIAKARGQ